MPSVHVPVVSLGALASPPSAGQRAALTQLRAACFEPGFFILDDSPLPGPLVTRTYAQSRTLHALPETHPVKTDLNRWYSDIGRGYSPRFQEPAYEEGSVATCASFDLAMERELQLPLRSAGNLGPNRWPDEADLPGFRRDVYAYYEGARKVAAELFVAFARMLSLPDDRFSKHYGDDAPCTMRMLHYPGAPERSNAKPPSKAGDSLTGISAHTDFEVFTLMHQDAPGLEMRDVHGNWVQAPLTPDQNLIILGDVMERWTNGTLRATPHRVPLTEHERHSLIVFCAVDADTLIEPMPEFITAERPAAYAPVTQGAHLDQAVSAALDNRDALASASEA